MCIGLPVKGISEECDLSKFRLVHAYVRRISGLASNKETNFNFGAAIRLEFTMIKEPGRMG